MDQRIKMALSMYCIKISMIFYDNNKELIQYLALVTSERLQEKNRIWVNQIKCESYFFHLK